MALLLLSTRKIPFPSVLKMPRVQGLMMPWAWMQGLLANGMLARSPGAKGMDAESLDAKSMSPGSPDIKSIGAGSPDAISMDSESPGAKGMGAGSPDTTDMGVGTPNAKSIGSRYPGAKGMGKDSPDTKDMGARYPSAKGMGAGSPVTKGTGAGSSLCSNSFFPHNTLCKTISANLHPHMFIVPRRKHTPREKAQIWVRILDLAMSKSSSGGAGDDVPVDAGTGVDSWPDLICSVLRAALHLRGNSLVSTIIPTEI